MLTLLLLRHAKSSWDDHGLEDFERPLAPRGVRNALAMGAYIAAQHLTPGFVLCSSAVRTRATLGLVLSAFPPAPEIVYADELYLAPPADMLDAVKAVDAQRRCVMLVGHNPGLHALGLALAGAGKADAITRLTEHMPTAALAVVRFEREKAWADIGVGQGRLERFVTPRTVA